MHVHFSRQNANITRAFSASNYNEMRNSHLGEGKAKFAGWRFLASGHATYLAPHPGLAARARE